jgi:uncharacterized membrane protein
MTAPDGPDGDDREGGHDDEGSDRPRLVGSGTGRLEAFSDGVFAIAITLLVLDLAMPSGRGSDLVWALLEEWPSYLAYLVSFCTIGSVWIAHAAITDRLERVDPVLLRINLVLLLITSFLPLPTRLLAEYLHSSAGERVAVTVYGGTLLAIRVTILTLWRYGAKRQLLRPEVADDEVATISEKLTPSVAGYVVALVIGLVLPLVAVLVYLLVAIYLMVPVRTITARLRRGA